MIENTIDITDAALRFHTVKTDRFKMSRLSFNFIFPADRERSPITRLMLATLMRGCEKYPSVVAINKRLDELYGATVTWRATTVGERHVFRISCEILGNKYRFSGDDESIVRSVAEVITEILFSPLKDEKGLLSKSNFESERGLAIDAVRAKINDQKSFAADRCKTLMFKGHPAGISIEGTIEQLEKITLSDVSENLEYFLKNSVIECYYVGSDDVLDVIDLVSEKFAKIGRESNLISGEEKVFERHMRRLCREAKSCNIPLEINMLGLRQGRNYPSDRFFRLVAEEGCPVVIGADAHKPEQVCLPDNYVQALEIVDRFDLQLITMPNIVKI